MAILLNKGRAAIAKTISEQPIHMAWGRGSVSWDVTTPPESVNAVGLTAEFGRRKATQVRFVVPDENGTILVPQGKFSVSLTPTKYLYTLFSFDFNDSPTEVIREVGIFIGTVPKSSVPVGQAYLLPSEVENVGEPLVLEHIQRIDRSVSVRQMFEFVTQF